MASWMAHRSASALGGIQQSLLSQEERSFRCHRLLVNLPRIGFEQGRVNLWLPIWELDVVVGGVVVASLTASHRSQSGRLHPALAPRTEVNRSISAPSRDRPQQEHGLRA